MSTHPAVALAAIPCVLVIPEGRATSKHQGPVGARLLVCSAVIACMVLPTSPVFAQLPAAARAASAPARASPQELAEKQTTSVFRWIKIMADAPPRKAEAPKPQPKRDPVATAPPLPITKKPVAVTATDGTGSPETHAITMVPRPAADPTLSQPADASPEASAKATPATSPPPAAAANEAAAAATPTVESADTEPTLKLVSQAQPVISDSLQQEVARGKVVVEFTVQPDGTVVKARAVNYTNRKLSKPAVEAVAKWMFEPLPTSLTAQVEIEFQLQ